MNKSQIFKNLITSPEILVMPCCHDALSAKVLEQTGFKAIAAAGYGLSGSLLGKPDFGLLTATEMINQYRNICSAVDIPVFVDIDTGYGDVHNVIRTVQECEKAGVAGLFIEDQVWPKRCGHMKGKKVITTEEFIPKLKAALFARKNKDFIITARTDAVGVHGIAEGIRRAKLYAEAGADMIFVEALHSLEDMKKVNTVLSRLNIPSMANIVEGGQTPMLSSKELQDIGYNLVAYPCSTTFTAVKAIKDMAEFLLKNGTTSGYQDKMLTFNEYYDFIEGDKIRLVEQELTVCK